MGSKTNWSFGALQILGSTFVMQTLTTIFRTYPHLCQPSLKLLSINRISGEPLFSLYASLIDVVCCDGTIVCLDLSCCTDLPLCELQPGFWVYSLSYVHSNAMSIQNGISINELLPSLQTCDLSVVEEKIARSLRPLSCFTRLLSLTVCTAKQLVDVLKISRHCCFPLVTLLDMCEEYVSFGNVLELHFPALRELVFTVDSTGHHRSYHHFDRTCDSLTLPAGVETLDIRWPVLRAITNLPSCSKLRELRLASYGSSEDLLRFLPKLCLSILKIYCIKTKRFPREVFERMLFGMASLKVVAVDCRRSLQLETLALDIPDSVLFLRVENHVLRDIVAAKDEKVYRRIKSLDGKWTLFDCPTT